MGETKCYCKWKMCFCRSLCTTWNPINKKVKQYNKKNMAFMVVLYNLFSWGNFALLLLFILFCGDIRASSTQLFNSFKRLKIKKSPPPKVYFLSPKNEDLTLNLHIWIL